MNSCGSLKRLGLVVILMTMTAFQLLSVRLCFNTWTTGSSANLKQMKHVMFRSGLSPSDGWLAFSSKPLLYILESVAGNPERGGTERRSPSSRTDSSNFFSHVPPGSLPCGQVFEQPERVSKAHLRKKLALLRTRYRLVYIVRSQRSFAPSPRGRISGSASV